MIHVQTNRHWRDLQPREAVPDNVLASDFDWTSEVDGFFCYQGYWYHLSQFMRCPGELAAQWDGYHGESFTTGIVVKLDQGGDRIQVGAYREGT